MKTNKNNSGYVQYILGTEHLHSSANNNKMEILNLATDENS